MRRITPILISILLIPFSTQVASAQFRTTNNATTLEVNDINIDPLLTPAPTPKDRIPSAKPSNQNLQVIQEQTSKAKNLEPKRFLTLYLSQSGIDFGSIDPTNPVVRTHVVRLAKGNAQAISLLGYENKPLTANNNIFIPDTSCDDGSCNQMTSGPWENTLTYGFGYRCDSEPQFICSSDFTQQSYKQFADVTRGESAEPIITNERDMQSVEARITYKVNIPGTQTKGIYQNAIIYLATPMY